jgi:hypothetical protein
MKIILLACLPSNLIETHAVWVGRDGGRDHGFLNKLRGAQAERQEEELNAITEIRLAAQRRLLSQIRTIVPH